MKAHFTIGKRASKRSKFGGVDILTPDISSHDP
jgi:hypothetical protein